MKYLLSILTSLVLFTSLSFAQVSSFPIGIATVTPTNPSCNNGNATLNTTNAQLFVCNNPTGSLSAGVWSGVGSHPSVTISTAALGTTLGVVRGSTVASYAGTITSGTLYSVRGDVSLHSGTTAGSGTYYAGTQGKAITSTGVVDIGSGYFAGVLGQVDVTGGTVTSGHVAPLIGNTFGFNSGTSTVLYNLYLEAAGGGVIQAQINTFGKATYWVDIQTNSHTPEANTSCTPSAVTGTTGGIHVIVDGVGRWIPLAATCT